MGVGGGVQGSCYKLTIESVNEKMYALTSAPNNRSAAEVIWGGGALIAGRLFSPSFRF